MINPVLETHPEELAIIGLLVVGYTELDFTLCNVCGLAIGDRWTVLKALHRVSNTGSRIEIIAALGETAFVGRDQAAQFGEAIGAIRFCKRVRNQYAHALWHDRNGSLHFKSAEEINWSAYTGPIDWRPISLSVLQEQETYFEYTRECLMWLENQVDQGECYLSWPEHMQRPPLQGRVG